MVMPPRGKRRKFCGGKNPSSYLLTSKFSTGLINPIFSYPPPATPPIWSCYSESVNQNKSTFPPVWIPSNFLKLSQLKLLLIFTYIMLCHHLNSFIPDFFYGRIPALSPIQSLKIFLEDCDGNGISTATLAQFSFIATKSIFEQWDASLYNLDVILYFIQLQLLHVW